MMRKSMMTVLVVLPLLITGQSSAMFKSVKEGVFDFCSKHKMILASSFSGFGAGFATLYFTKGSGALKDKKHDDIHKVIVLPEESVRRMFKLAPEDELPKNILDRLFQEVKAEVNKEKISILEEHLRCSKELEKLREELLGEQDDFKLAMVKLVSKDNSMGIPSGDFIEWATKYLHDNYTPRVKEK